MLVQNTNCVWFYLCLQRFHLQLWCIELLRKSFKKHQRTQNHFERYGAEQDNEWKRKMCNTKGWIGWGEEGVRNERFKRKGKGCSVVQGWDAEQRLGPSARCIQWALDIMLRWYEIMKLLFSAGCWCVILASAHVSPTLDMMYKFIEWCTFLSCIRLWKNLSRV